MKILFVANRVPYPPFRGDKLKIYNLARRLSAHHEVYLITFAESSEDFGYIGELQKIFKKVILIRLPLWKSYLNCLIAVFTGLPFQVAYFRSRKMKHTVNRFMERNPVDVIHTQHLRMAHFTAGLNHPKILDLPDAFSLYWKRRIDNQGNALLKWLQTIEYKRLYAFEGAISKQFSLTLVCSREDLNYMKEEHGVQNIRLLRNGVDLDTFNGADSDYRGDRTVLFTGNMDYAPNVDAVVYFTREIWPLILAQKPGLKFIIAGQRPVKQVLDLQSPQIEVTGFVPDLKEMYQKASVVVSPLRFGAGTQNKVLEAMAMGIPVVSGNIGFEGLEINSGEGVFLETEPGAFARKVVELLNSDTLRRTTGTRGKEIARNKFSWDFIASCLEQYCRDTVAG